MAPRRGPRAPAPSSGRLASLLFGIGCLVVLGATFSLGVAAGRRWPSGLPGLGGAPAAPAAAAAAPVAAATARGEREGSRRPEGRGFDKDKAKTTADGSPVLTYYHELTAPLTSTPPPARGAAKTEPKTAETIKSAPRSAEALKSVASAAASPVEAPLRERTPVASAGSPTSELRFTVQVGAFALRAQAEALRARLAEGGQEVYVTEAETGGVAQYRVRVGTFATREAARDAAARLATERRLATYVTTR